MSYINTEEELILSTFKVENHVILVEIRIVYFRYTFSESKEIEFKMIKFNC